MLSECSALMFKGPVSPLFTTAITIGRRLEAATYTTSHIRASPADDVAVRVLAPAALAPMAALIELCSLSTGINSVSISPFAIILDTNWGISVEGVIGNAGITSGLIWRTAYAVASFPDILVLIAIYFPSFIEIAPKGHAFSQIPQPLQCTKSKPSLFLFSTGIQLSGQ